jgi:hypothetical protein
MTGTLLQYGLDVLQQHMPAESVYRDPPFKSDQHYTVLCAERDIKAAAQVTAFEDTCRRKAPH